MSVFAWFAGGALCLVGGGLLTRFFLHLHFIGGLLARESSSLEGLYRNYVNLNPM